MDKIFENQQFVNINYSGQKVAQTEFESCLFKDCNFSEADFSDSDFINCRFENCNFALTKISGSGLKEVYFTGCKLVGIDFEVCSNFLFEVNG